MIVCLEGIDACGKATQAKLLAERLGAKLYSFPDYSSPTGQLIGQHLRQEWYAVFEEQSDCGCDRCKVGRQPLNALVFQSLMLTNRLELASMLARHRMYSQDAVLDRYWPSGVVYGGADGLDHQYLLDIHRILPQAHYYLLIDISPELSSERRPERRDRYEAQSGLMEQAAERYRALWAEMKSQGWPGSWSVVDGDGTVQEVRGRIWQALRLITSAT